MVLSTVFLFLTNTTLWGCGATDTGTTEKDAGEELCQSGEQSCDGNSVIECIDGVFEAVQVCEGACSPGQGCTLCVANEVTCEGDIAKTCSSDGNRVGEYECDSVQGMACSSDGCVGSCSPRALGTSYIGCEYFPTVTANLVASSPFLFAVSVSNTQNTEANITIDGAGLATPILLTVPPNDVIVHRLPWQDQLKGVGGNSVLARDGAYRLRSDQPVTAFQFSPLNFRIGEIQSNTNDASLLYPSNALGREYRVASWPTWMNMPGFMAITAVHDDTTVVVTTTAGVALGDLPILTPGIPQEITLNRGDVIELLTRDGDLTGSEVVSDRPVQVIGGHSCTNIPANLVACDHLEEVILPIAVLGTQYVVTAPAVTTLPDPKVRHVRIIATQADTSLTFDPPQAGAPTTLAMPGDFVELASNANDFAITSSKRVLVAEYMNGRAAGLDDEGDPALSLGIPVEQFRNNYLFHAPPSYESNFVNIVAPNGATITLDGMAVAGFVPVGNSDYSAARVLLGAGQGGNHNISGSEAFGISVYGYGFATSYWYPGGLDLTPIPID